MYSRPIVARRSSTATSGAGAMLWSVARLISRKLLVDRDNAGGAGELERHADVPDGDVVADRDLLVGVGAYLSRDHVAYGAELLAGRAFMTDAHPAAELRGETRGLGLLQDGVAVVVDVVSGLVQRQSAGRVGGVQVDRRYLEVLQPQPVGGVELFVGVAYVRDQARGPTDVRRRRRGVDAQMLEVVDREAALDVAAARSARVDAGDPSPRAALLDLVELGVEDLVLARPRVVQEGDGAVVAPVAQAAQHRHDGSDPAAAADQQQVVGHRIGQHEVALGEREMDQRSGCEFVA